MEILNEMFQLHVLIRNNKSYWDFTTHEKTNQNVCQHYNKVIYEIIDAFMGPQPMLHPLHVHDFVAPNNMILLQLYFNEESIMLLIFIFISPR